MKKIQCMVSLLEDHYKLSRHCHCQATVLKEALCDKKGSICSIISTVTSLAAPRVQPLDGVVRALPNQRLPCSATGIPPIYTALIRNSTVLVNTTNTATIRLHEEGNYSCVATSKYGTDRKEFSVVFTGKTFCGLKD